MFRFSGLVASNLSRLDISDMPSDRELAAWARLQHMAEVSFTELGFDEGCPQDLQKGTTQAVVRAFEKQLASWKECNWKSIHGEYVWNS